MDEYDQLMHSIGEYTQLNRTGLMIVIGTILIIQLARATYDTIKDMGMANREHRDKVKDLKRSKKQ